MECGMKRMVLALGGNALSQDVEGTIESQRQTIEKAVTHIEPLASAGHELVFTHGNGPQVGQLLVQNEESTSTPPRPLDVLVAETQAQIGYLLQQALGNALGVPPVTVITQVRVDPTDSAFDRPTKRIGPFLDPDTIANRHFEVAEDSNTEGETGYRRVVPSPHPVEIIESEQIASLVDTGRPVICAGGGGVPVIEFEGGLEGIEAVIDKDHSSQVLANQIDADELLLLTDVQAAYRDFATPERTRLDVLTTDEARTLLDADEFGEGSMAPKVHAGITFVEQGGSRALITAIDTLTEALDGETGTRIVQTDT